MRDEHCLYRFFNHAGDLLYVGITMNPTSRFSQHRAGKDWWTDVARIDMEQHHDRASVLAAERAAIIAEQPLHNIVHNRGSRKIGEPSSPESHPSGTDDDLLEFQSLRSGITYRDRLSLWWELAGDPMSDDYDPATMPAIELFNLWARRWAKDPDKPMRIWWFIFGPKTKIELAWLTPDDIAELPHWARYYTTPREAHTGRVRDLRSLPVYAKRWTPQHADKGGFISEATGFTPYPGRGWVTGRELLFGVVPHARHLREVS